MTFRYYDLVWARWWQRSCKDPIRAYGYRGRCELRRGHDGHHAIERGMEWVRWDPARPWQPWPTQPGARDQANPKGPR